MNLPEEVTFLLERMTAAGYHPWLVGGSVRSLLTGNVPKDWDIAVDAPVETIRRMFADLPLADMGEVYGVLGVRLAGAVCEVASFRREADYRDGRRPKQVSFTPDLREDLQRRDFTINAMAYHPQCGLVDIFGGRDDLRRGVLRTVGRPEVRFREDSLRMLRGLRLASELDFSLETKTDRAMLQNRALLRSLPGERVREELERLLTGKGAARVLRSHWSTAGEVLPEILPMVGFAQHTKYHHLDVFNHTVEALASVTLWQRKELSQTDKATAAWALLLHDSGKPAVFSMDAQGRGHFYGHAKASVAVTQTVAKRLRFPRKLMEDVTVLVRAHDVPLLQGEKTWGRWLDRLGKERLALLLLVQEGDALAHAPEHVQPRLGEIHRCRQKLERLTVNQGEDGRWRLAIGGRDLQALGVNPGPYMGHLLKRLTEEVLAERLPNEEDALLQRTRIFLHGDEPGCERR